MVDVQYLEINDHKHFNVLIYNQEKNAVLVALLKVSKTSGSVEANGSQSQVEWCHTCTSQCLEISETDSGEQYTEIKQL